MNNDCYLCRRCAHLLSATIFDFHCCFCSLVHLNERKIENIKFKPQAVCVFIYCGEQMPGTTSNGIQSHFHAVPLCLSANGAFKSTKFKWALFKWVQLKRSKRQKQINKNSRAQKVHKMENENTQDTQSTTNWLEHIAIESHVMHDSSAICMKSVRRIRVCDVCVCVCFAVYMYIQCNLLARH